MKKKDMEWIRDVGITILILAVATLTGLVFQNRGFHETNIVVAYLFSALLISRFTKGYGCGILASVASILLFNWFFTRPYYTLKVDDPTYLITFVVILFASVMTSALTTKVKKTAEEASRREEESNALYRMTNHLTDAEDTGEIGEIMVKSAGEVLNCPVACLSFDEKGMPEKAYVQRKEDGSIIRRELENPEELKKRMEQLHGGVDITKEHYDYPIYGKNTVLAVLRIPATVGRGMSQEKLRMIHSIMESGSLALDRMRSLKAQVRSREETTRERYRGNLLRAISHDIRTPLSGMMGTSEILMGKLAETDPCHGLATDIYQDAQWLHGLVENILNLTKLQDGKLVLTKEPEAVEEVIGAALMVMEKRKPGLTVEINVPDCVLMVPMDARLISQVLVNLLDNGVKHNKENPQLSISAEREGEVVAISVADRGKGIAECDLPHIFQMFYTTAEKSPDSSRGVGLGLAICQSIVEAHGGSIRAENRQGGGAVFTFTLPMKGESL